MRGDRRRAEQRARAAPPDAADPRRRRASRRPGRCRRRRRSGGSSPASATSPSVGERIVTTSPDVSVSTNLGGWINKVGRVRAHRGAPTSSARIGCCAGSSRRRASTSSSGISEMNLFLLLHALGLGHELHGQHLLPIGTVYDPFVCRGLDALIYGLYSGSRFVVVGTPAGITLAPEGGAHQSTITPSIGLELPGLTYAEPAYAQALDWLLCDGLADLAAPGGGSSLYLRLSTRPDRPGAVRGRRASGSASSACAPTCSPAATGCASRTMARPRSCWRRAGRWCPRCSPPPSALDAEGVPALVLDLTQPGPAVPRRGATSLRAAARRRADRRGDDHHLGDVAGTRTSGRCRSSRPRRRQPPPRLARRRSSEHAPCPSASTSSASRAASPSSTASSTCSPSRSSTPRSSRCPEDLVLSVGIASQRMVATDRTVISCWSGCCPVHRLPRDGR